MERNLRKERVGIVVSDKMDKTVVVAIEERYKHPLYKKTIKCFIKNGKFNYYYCKYCFDVCSGNQWVDWSMGIKSTD
mgnify:CR=1 FL=1